MGPIIALALLAQAPGSAPADPCLQARHRYEALAFEEALVDADAGLALAPGALGCLEVKALVLLASGRPEEARAVLTRLFEIAPDHEVADPSLSPSTRAQIEAVRDAVRPLTARVTARWIVHRSLRLDIALEGGLRDARRVRYRAELGPSTAEAEGEVPLVGPAATATLAVDAGTEAQTLTLSGTVLDAVGRPIIPFSSQILLPERPALDLAAAAAPPAASGPPWWLWVVLGAVVVGGTVTAAVIAQPDLPDASGTVGRTRL